MTGCANARMASEADSGSALISPPRRTSWRCRRYWLASLCTIFLFAVVSARAWAQFPEPFYVNQPNFRIPFQIEDSEQARLREVQLFVSFDQGRSWREVARASPHDRHFTYRASGDGEYWFVVRTVDNEGRMYPAALEGVRPGLIVIVDSMPPRASLEVLPSGSQEVGIRWLIQDEHLDPSTLEIEWRSPRNDWQPLSCNRQAQGTKSWSPGACGPIEVRLRVRDRAGNLGQASAVIPTSPTLGPNAASTSAQTGTATLGGVPLRIVNSNEVSLAYSLEDVGPSGIASVELWMTRDGKTWSKLGEDDDKISPLVARLPGEGLYGLSLAVRNGVGNGQPPPRPGEPPQLWLEVDLTPPRVQILSCEPARGGPNGILTITWSASDKNLAPQPINLYYASRSAGPWTNIASSLENTGRYVWHIPNDTPYQFYVRVEAVDRAGNVGTAETPKPVIVDLSVPRGRLLGIEGQPR